jgi:hypothetical protein
MFLLSREAKLHFLCRIGLHRSGKGFKRYYKDVAGKLMCEIGETCPCGLRQSLIFPEGRRWEWRKVETDTRRGDE